MPLHRRLSRYLPCGCLALALTSCSTKPQYNGFATQSSSLASAHSVPSEYQIAKDFSDAYRSAESLEYGIASLKGVKEVSVAVVISENFVSNTYTSDCRNELIQKLRQAGLVVKEKSNTVVMLEVVGMWNQNDVVASFHIELHVDGYGHFVRHGRHFESFAEIWSCGRLGVLGRDVFGESFSQTVNRMEDEFINGWITANQ